MIKVIIIIIVLSDQTTEARSYIIVSLLNPKTENLIMSLHNDIVSFWFWGYRQNFKLLLSNLCRRYLR